MSRSFTISGQAGTIPDDEYLRKIQQTDIYEDPEDYENYGRSILSDFRPDKPFFESEQIRDPNDSGSGYGSREKLSLLHNGTRYDADPYLPDGTFLDHEFAVPDPRGVETITNLSGARKQAIYRNKMIPYHSDNSFSVPESNITPAAMRENIRSYGQKDFQNRYVNFEESMDNWSNPKETHKKGSHVVMTTHDGTIMNLADADYLHRQDPINLISNRQPSLLRMSGTDQRKKVSKYGMIRARMNYSDINIAKNKENSFLDHNTVELNGQMVNRMLANLIVDLEGQRNTKQIVTQGTNYDDSTVNLMRESRTHIHPDDLYKMMLIGLSSSSQTPSANQEFFENSYRINHGSKINIKSLNGKSKLNHHIADIIVQSNKKQGKKNVETIQNLVKKSAADYGLYQELNNNRRNVTEVTNTLVREGMGTQYIEDQKTIKNYGKIPPKYELRHSKDFVNPEEFAKNSKNNLHRNGITAKTRGATVNDVDGEAKMEEFELPGHRYRFNPKESNPYKKNTDFGDIDRNDLSDMSDKPLDLQTLIGEMLIDK